MFLSWMRQQDCLVSKSVHTCLLLTDMSSQTAVTADQPCVLNVLYVSVYPVNLFPSSILRVNSDSPRTKSHLKSWNLSPLKLLPCCIWAAVMPRGPTDFLGEVNKVVYTIFVFCATFKISKTSENESVPCGSWLARGEMSSIFRIKHLLSEVCEFDQILDVIRCWNKTVINQRDTIWAIFKKKKKKLYSHAFMYFISLYVLY